jgi:virginiamycin B lyase
VQPHAYGIVRGPDGNIWFTEWVRNAIVKLDVATGAFTYFSVFALGFGAPGITVGPHNALWFAINSTNPAIGRLDPVSGAITTFVRPQATDPLAITLGPDGNLWFTRAGSMRWRP